MIDPKEEKILAALSKAVVEFKKDECKNAALEALDYGMDPSLAVMNGLTAGMKQVGVLYENCEYFVLEALLSVEAFYAGLNVLKPFIKKGQNTPKVTVIIGSIQGDLHDIGKNLVKVMFDAAGWETHDLGRDVPFEKFIEKQIEVNADILAMSAMMTTTMMGMKKVISLVKSNRLKCLTMVGGAPVTKDIADLFGADGYATSAGSVVSEGLQMIARTEKSH